MSCLACPCSLPLLSFHWLHRPPPMVGRPGSVRRRHVVKAPPVVDSGAVERAEPAGFVSAEPVAPAVEPDVPPAHDDEAAPSIRVSPPQAHDPVQAMMAGYRDLDPSTRALLTQAFSRYTHRHEPRYTGGDDCTSDRRASGSGSSVGKPEGQEPRRSSCCCLL